MTNPQYLIIQNDGELDPLGLTLLGASTKRNDESKIGFFGSGFKYALARFLRGGLAVRVFCGETEIAITTEDVHFRGQCFTVLCVNGQRTSITLDTGPQWDLPDAVREIWSNAIDEGGAMLRIHSEIQGVAGKTKIAVSLCPVIEQMVHNWGNYFCNRTPKFMSSVGAVYDRVDPITVKPIIYRKGIWCLQQSAPPLGSLVDYELPYVQLNEARKTSDWDVQHEVRKFWCLAPSKEAVLFLLNNIKPNTWEWRALNTGAAPGLSAAWMELAPTLNHRLVALDQLEEVPSDRREHVYILPPLAVKELCKVMRIKPANWTAPSDVPVEVPVTPEMQENIDIWCEILEPLFGSPLEFPIKVGRFSDPECFGWAYQRTIWINRDSTFHMVGQILVEEYIHLEYGAKDCTRDMQHAYNDAITSTLTGIHNRKK